MQLSTGAKGWLWFLFIVNIIGGMLNLISLILTGILGLFSVVSSIILIIGVGIMLFQQKKLGFYLMCVSAVISLISNLVIGTGFIAAVVGAGLLPLITFLVLKNCWDQMR